jgi:hypothetical protein
MEVPVMRLLPLEEMSSFLRRILPRAGQVNAVPKAGIWAVIPVGRCVSK